MINERLSTTRWTIFTLLALIGTVLMFFSSELIHPSERGSQPAEYALISQHEAAAVATSFAEANYPVTVTHTEVVNVSDDLVYGYFAKHALFDEFEAKAANAVALDQYLVTLTTNDLLTLYAYVNVATSKVVEWDFSQLIERADASPFIDALNDQQVTEAVRSALAERELTLSKLSPLSADVANGTFTYQVPEWTIEDAVGSVSARLIHLEDRPYLISYRAELSAPESYVLEINRQERLGTLLYTFGSQLPTLIMFIVAIIMAIQLRKQTSFNRGWLLALLFLVFYVANTFVSLDSFVVATLANGQPNESMRMYGLIAALFQTLVLVYMATETYFSFVAGQGLWNSNQRYDLWPRRGEHGYGEHVWRSARLGYLFAFILLGIQALMLEGLFKVSGAWATSDAASSLYNVSIPLLFPLLAWCAAINEEAVYRYFGIGMLVRWFRGRAWWLAALIPNVIWALGHVLYPIYPTTTRLWELIVLGLLFTWIFMRYGLITAIFAHAIFDTVLMSFGLVSIGGTVNTIGAMFYIIVPLLLGYLVKRASPVRSGHPPSSTPLHAEHS